MCKGKTRERISRKPSEVRVLKCQMMQDNQVQHKQKPPVALTVQIGAGSSPSRSAS